MEIIPIKQEYDFSIGKHTMRAVAEHTDAIRKLSYYFDQKLVATKEISDGDYYTDDDCIREVIEEYKQRSTDAYADIFNNHIDRVYLVTKILEVNLVNYGIVLNAKVKITKDTYEIDLRTDSGDNQVSGKFKAADFSEVLEKMRLFTNTLEGVSAELAQKISILANDKIEEVIKWQE